MINSLGYVGTLPIQYRMYALFSVEQQNFHRDFYAMVYLRRALEKWGLKRGKGLGTDRASWLAGMRMLLLCNMYWRVLGRVYGRWDRGAFTSLVNRALTILFSPLCPINFDHRTPFSISLTLCSPLTVLSLAKRRRKCSCLMELQNSKFKQRWCWNTWVA